MLSLPEMPRTWSKRERSRFARLWQSMAAQEQTRWVDRLAAWRRLEDEVADAEIELQRLENQRRAKRDPYRWAYIAAALRQAVYKPYPDGTIYGEIPTLRGVLANESTQEACAVELAAALDSWITARLRRHLPIPVIAGIDLNTASVVSPATPHQASA